MPPTQPAPQAPVAPTPPAPPPLPLPAISPEQAELLSKQAAARADADLHALQAAQAAADANAPVVARVAPRTAAELAALREQRKSLSDQLVSAQGRRRDVAQALERAHDPVNQAGLQQRLQVLDRRILQLESDIAETGRLITTAPAVAVVGTEASRFRPPNFDRGPSESVVAIVFIVSVCLPLAIALAKILVRRTRVAAPDPALREAAARLARLEQAVDAIAVEVERVSEGQRFVTRLLADTRGQTEQAPALQGTALGEYRPG